MLGPSKHSPEAVSQARPARTATLLSGLFPSRRTTCDSVCSTDTWDRRDLGARLHGLKFIFFQEIVLENRNPQEMRFLIVLFWRDFEAVAEYTSCVFCVSSCIHVCVYVCVCVKSVFLNYILRQGLSWTGSSLIGIPPSSLMSTLPELQL